MIHWDGGRVRRRGSGLIALAGVMFALALVFSMGGSFGSAVDAANSDIQLLEIELLERNESGISGLVTITSSNPETRIEIEVRGAVADYLPYLHLGTCDEYAAGGSIPLAVTQPGEPVSTTVDLPIEELAAGTYVVDLHIARGSLESLMDPSTSVACGAIVTGDPAGATVQPPITGIGPFDGDNVNWLVVTLTGFGVLFGFAGLLARRVPLPLVAEDVNQVALQRLRGLFV